MSNNSNPITSNNFSSKVVKAVGITLLMLLCAYILFKGFKVLLLLLAAVLVCVFFRGVASFFQSFLPIKKQPALVIALIIVTGLIIGLFILLAPSISEQVKVLEKELPKAFNHFVSRAQQTAVGGFIDEEIIKGGINYEKYTGTIKVSSILC